MSAATQSSAPLKRIRNLLALTQSSNPHEAARAREQADELLQRYGLTEADCIEQATETTNLPHAIDGHQRDELARVVAKSRGVKVRDSHPIAFVGYPEAAKDARQLFTALVGIVESACHIDSPDAFLWRTCFWLGYVEAIQKQLDPEHSRIPAAAMPSILKNAVTPPIIQRAAQAFDNMSARLGNNAAADQFKSIAHVSGRELGQSVPVPAYRQRK